MVLLVSMAYDRYMAICKPLHYSSIMDRHVCIGLVMASWIIGFLHSVSQLVLIVKLPFCGPRELDHSTDGTSKTLSTCTAHITVVVLFFGPCIFIYLWPVSITWVDKFLAVFYAVITPLLNPAIYTLRNKEIKNAMKRLQC
ncbi:Olfactory receptor 4K17 [Sciurus carolinensis]|uniref:Olfactory receptor 4K17 n=1 Tax=Sciurus carolinensis TaxID=30640 RepID=A0AA41MHN6_SCICA|nr:Olfactory receptor 4K17 [Sciurus carolinensis]